jgi:hypothetical protein
VNVKIGSVLALVAAFACLVPFMSVPTFGQESASKGKIAAKAKEPEDKETPAGPTPRMPDGKVDFSGLYIPGLGAAFASMGGPVPLQPWAQKVLDERRANLSKDDPEGKCLPAGVPRISPFPYKLVQTQKLLVLLDEGNVHSYRQIFLDGRGHPKDLEPTWMGHSIGTWDGDALVIDTVGFNDKTWLNGQGVPHTDALHVVERLTRPDLGHLVIDVTIEDPKAFTAPHKFQRVHLLRPNWEIQEYVCNEFNIDVDRLVGK